MQTKVGFKESYRTINLRFVVSILKPRLYIKIYVIDSRFQSSTRLERWFLVVFHHF